MTGVSIKLEKATHTPGGWKWRVYRGDVCIEIGRTICGLNGMERLVPDASGASLEWRTVKRTCEFRLSAIKRNARAAIRSHIKHKHGKHVRIAIISTSTLRGLMAR